MNLQGRGGIFAATSAWTALAAVLAVRVAGRAADDFFITYRYAWNLVHGHGFVFNPGERVFGLTDPGLGLLLAGFNAITRVPIPILGTVTTAVSLVGIALVLLLDLGERGRRIEALAGGTLLVGSSWMWVSQGAGVFPSLLLLLLAARLAGRRAALAGLLAGAAVWMRPDALAGAGLLGLLLWSERRLVPWRYAVVSLAVIGLGAGAAWLWFGTAVPNTVGAKIAMASAAAAVQDMDPLRFWVIASSFLPRHWGPWWAAVVALGITGQVPLFLGSGRAGRLLVLFGAALAVIYPLIGAPFFIWYTAVTLAALLYGLPALGLWWMRASAQPATRPWRLAGGAVALAVFLPVFVSLIPRSCRWFRSYNWQRNLEVYQQAALWIRERSAPDEAIAYVEIGVLAYASERPVVDLLGLVTPEAVPFVLANDLPGAFLARPAPWVLHHTRGRMESLIQRRWFRRNFREVVRFEKPGGGRLTVYHIRRDARLPPPRPPREPAPPRTPGRRRGNVPKAGDGTPSSL